MQTSLHEVRSVEELASLRPAWGELLGRARAYSYTHTPDYAFLAAEIALRKGGRAFVVQAMEGGQLVGGWCLTAEDDGMLTTARAGSCGNHEEYAAPLVDAAYAAPAIAAIVRQCRAIPVDKVLAKWVADGGQLAGHIGRFTRRVERIDGFSTALSRFPDWEAYAAHTSRSHLYNLRRAKRRLEDQGDLVIDWCRTPADVDTVLRWAWQNKRDWARPRGIDTPYLRDDTVPEFFVDLAGRVDLETYPLVTFMRLNGELLAAQINLVGDTVFELVFTTFSPSQARWSPGDLLIQHSFQWALAHGLDYDFRILRAGYKERVSDTVTSYTTYEISRTPKAWIINLLVLRIRPAIARLRRAPRKAWRIAKGLADKLRRREREGAAPADRGDLGQ